MFRLIVTSDTQPTVSLSFDRSSIIIGSEHADLVLQGESLQERHVQIVEELIDNRTYFFTINLANDPFTTLNGLPFGKQPIYNNDLIQIEQFTIRFETALMQPRGHSMTNEDNDDEKLSQSDIEALVRQAESLAQYEKAVPLLKPEEFQQPIQAAPQSSLPSLNHSPKSSLKDDYLREYDDDGDGTSFMQRNSHYKLPAQNTNSWRLLFKLFVSLMIIAAMVSGFVYIWFSDQSGEEEIKASKAIADVAMALTYAQIKNIHPQNQNWSDPEFIKNNLTAVLGAEYASLAEFDNHGKFAKSPYMLRIYTSSNLSQFLVIAQPAPSLFQWLIPKATIIIDSHAMDMRKITDLKALNRLLVNANTLDTSNAKEISSLIQQGQLIPLSTLVNAKESQGFAPPKALALIRPGAENLVYNLPRYYSLGQNLLDQSIEVVERPTTGNEINMIQQELTSLSTFPNLVLYSHEGIQHAIRAQKALSMISLKEKFLIAYLQLNTKGKISSTHLLMDDAPADVALETQISTKAGDIWKNTQLPSLLNPSADQEISEHNDPIFMQLSSLSTMRLHMLKPISDEIISLLNLNTHAVQPDFSRRFSELQKKIHANQ